MADSPSRGPERSDPPGSEPADAVVLLETKESAVMAFATRALEAEGIAFTLVEDRPAEGTVKRMRRLLVARSEAEAAMGIVAETLRRRARLDKLPRQSLGGSGA